jgi:hypothetical protein
LSALFGTLPEFIPQALDDNEGTPTSGPNEIMIALFIQVLEEKCQQVFFAQKKAKPPRG